MTKPIQIKNLTIGAGIPKICVPLTGTTEEKICQEAKDAKKAGADLVEWRADFFEGLMDKEACKQVLGKLSEILGETPLLFTIRTSEEGGNIAISMEDYSACCRNAARSHIADLVDVEVMGNPEEKKKLVAELQREGVKIIASSHDFDKTDSQEILLDRFREMEKSGAEYVHIDVMDGEFVPNITFGMPVIKAIRNKTNKVFDVHLMINNPQRYIDGFIDAGADIITLHYEAEKHLDRAIQYIKSKGVKAAVALNPATPVCVLKNIIANLDMVLIMSVNPGFGGQSFIPYSLDKIKEVKEMAIKAGNENILIQVDGGIGKDNVKDVIEAGANVIVAGSAIFNGGDIEENIKSLRG